MGSSCSIFRVSCLVIYHLFSRNPTVSYRDIELYSHVQTRKHEDLHLVLLFVPTSQLLYVDGIWVPIRQGMNVPG